MLDWFFFSYEERPSCDASPVLASPEADFPIAITLESSDSGPVMFTCSLAQNNVYVECFTLVLYLVL